MSRVLLADDHPLFRHALRAIITRERPELQISEAESFAGVQAILAQQDDVVLVTLDLKMSDCGDFAGLLFLRNEYPDIPIIIVSSSSDDETIKRAVAFGAAGFIPKSTDHGEIIRAINTVFSGQVWVPVSTEEGRPTTRTVSTLTPTQMRILMGLQRGLRNKEIAYEIGVSEKTVKAYMSAVFRKLGVNSRTQALIAIKSIEEMSDSIG